MRIRRPVPLVPHMHGLFELERLADETVALAEQMKKTVADLRQQDTDRAGDGDDEERG